MNPGLLFLLLNAIFGVIFLCIFLPIVITRRRYARFVENHSLSLRAFEAIKTRYKFVTIANNDLCHDYDNAAYYSIISPEDFLIAYLVRGQKEVRDNCKAAQNNKTNLKELKREAREQCHPGRYDQIPNVKFPRLLDSIEEKIISSRMPVVQTEFSLEVTLKRINANGVFLEEKRARFTAEEIMELIHRLNNKQGDFYLDRAIFDALCRVERGKVTNRMRFAVYRRDGGCCAKCGSTFNLEVDHIIPISKGGKSVMENLQTLCHRCNIEKGSRIE